LSNLFLINYNMEIQFSPTNNINLIQRNNKILKKIKIKLTRKIKKINTNQELKIKRVCY
jgi:hypothetical protein